MKFLTVFLALFGFATLFGKNKSEDKIYLNSDQIAIQNNQLFVFLENQWIPTNALFSNENGVYVEKKWYEPWECSYCQAVNPPTNLVCWRCNR